jgi:hypothetical protein
MMDKLERLAYWKTVAADAARAARRDGVADLEAKVWKDEDDLYAFFDCFRPDGKELEKVFAGVVGGDEIRQRLLRVYESTKESFNAWGYFIVRRPAPATRQNLVELTAQHFDRVRQIARSYRHTELAALMATLPQIGIVPGRAPDRKLPDDEAPETLIYDVVGDWFRGLVPVESDALWLDEAFYSIACDYNIARYLLWPLFRHSTEIEEPFAPYFELWTHGAQAIFEKPGRVTVYVAGDTEQRAG